MTDWRNDPTLEAPASRQAREQAYAAAVARGAGASCAPSPNLSEEAIRNILRAAKLSLSKEGERNRDALASVLERVAHRAIHREAFSGDALSRPDDLEKLLRVWKRMRSKRKEVRRKAEAEMRQHYARARDKGSYGRIPPPLEHPKQFESWLADAAFAHGVERELMAKCLDATAFATAQEETERVADTLDHIGRDRASRPSLDGGAPLKRERRLRTVKLLAVFSLLFGVEPNGASADKQPTRGGTWSSDPAHGGAATRFVHAFEAEIVRAIKERALSDPTRKEGRPCQWETGEENAVNMRIRRLIGWCADVNEETDEPIGPPKAHRQPWKKWTLERLQIG